MSQNLFVSGLSYDTTDESLRGFFASIGPVSSAKVVTDRETGRSRGFGFVEFEDESNNQAAIDKLNGTDLDGRTISVNVARPKEDRPRRDFNGPRTNSGPRSFDNRPRRSF